MHDSTWSNAGQGVRQGCVAYAFNLFNSYANLFNSYAEGMVRIALDGFEGSVTVAVKISNNAPS